jgi:hypothetical protein
MSNYEGSAARTVTVKVSDDRWTRLGEGPAIVGVHGSEIMFATGDVEPSGDDVGLLVRFDGSPIPVQTQIGLWAKACFGVRNARAVVLPVQSGPVSANKFR